MALTTVARELGQLDAVGQAALVHSGELGPLDLIEAGIQRIEHLNPTLGAVITPLYERGRRDALAAPTRSPFAGVPFLLKDALAESAGDPRSEGMLALLEADWHDDCDSYFTSRLLHAGLALCGKTNLSEPSSFPGARLPLTGGPVRNPWDLRRTSGGSGGGSAAAVASGMVPVASATDIGGSIRVTAGMCGIVGLKPTRGRLSLGPAFGDYYGSFASQFLLTRTIRDAAALLDVLAGAEPGDPYAAPAPQRPYFLEVGAPECRLRFGILTQRPDGDTRLDGACRDAAEEAAAMVESLGHVVVEADTRPLGDLGGPRAGRVVKAVSMAREVERWSARLSRPFGPADVEPRTWALAEAGSQVSAVEYVAAMEAVNTYSRGVATMFDEIDVLITPTLPQVTPLLGEQIGDDRAYLKEDRPGTLTAYTAPFNMTGQPAISLPLHWTPDGQPVGVQFVAAFGREDLLIRLASHLEALVRWPSRWPPVSCEEMRGLLLEPPAGNGNSNGNGSGSGNGNGHARG